MLRQGHLHLLHREQQVDAFQPLSASPPAPLHRSSVSAGYVGVAAPVGPTGRKPPSSHSVRFAHLHWLPTLALLWHGGRAGPLTLLLVPVVFGAFLMLPQQLLLTGLPALLSMVGLQVASCIRVIGLQRIGASTPRRPAP